MANMLLPLLTFLLLVICELVESRYCTYLTADGFVRTIVCSSYEYCCGNACCRPAAFTFYQFWYFWLTVILIMLLCSGGSWWYRFRYRNQLSPPATFGTRLPPVNPSALRTNTGAVYYPGADRVYLQTQPKDPYMRGAAMQFQPQDLSNQAAYPGFSMQPPPPPPYGNGPPPSYDSIIMQNAMPAPYLPQNAMPAPYLPQNPNVNPPTTANPPYPVQPLPQMYPQPPLANPNPVQVNPFSQEQDANLRNRYSSEPT